MTTHTHYALVTFGSERAELRFLDEKDMMSFFRLNGFVDASNVFFNERVLLVHDEGHIVFERAA